MIEGVKTSIPLHQALLEQPDVLSGDYSIKWLEEWLAEAGGVAADFAPVETHAAALGANCMAQSINALLTPIRTAALALLCAMVLPGSQARADDTAAQQVVVDDDGTVHAPAMSVPMSEYLTPEGKAYVTQHLKAMQQPEMSVEEDGVPRFMQPYILRSRELYPTIREETNVGGVHAYVYAPVSGIAPENANRVLINLHGGGFSGCWPGCAGVEIDSDFRPRQDQGGGPRLPSGSREPPPGRE